MPVFAFPQPDVLCSSCELPLATFRGGENARALTQTAAPPRAPSYRVPVFAFTQRDVLRSVLCTSWELPLATSRRGENAHALTRAAAPLRAPALPRARFCPPPTRRTLQLVRTAARGFSRRRKCARHFDVLCSSWDLPLATSRGGENAHALTRTAAPPRAPALPRAPFCLSPTRRALQLVRTAGRDFSRW